MLLRMADSKREVEVYWVLGGGVGVEVVEAVRVEVRVCVIRREVVRGVMRARRVWGRMEGCILVVWTVMKPVQQVVK